MPSLIEKGIFHTYESTANERSLAQSSRDLLDHLGVTLVSTGFTISRGSYLIIPNHPGGLDGHAIRATCGVANLHSVSLASAEVFGGQYKGHMFPIYAKPRIKDKLSQLLVGDLGTHVLTDTGEISRRNRQSITHAAQTVDEGNPVLLFPTGSAGKASMEGHWKAGVGYLVKQLKNPKTQIVFAKIGGANETDLYRFIHPRLRYLLFRSKVISVTYSDPITVHDFNIHPSTDEKLLTYQLEQRYSETFSEK